MKHARGRFRQFAAESLPPRGAWIETPSGWPSSTPADGLFEVIWPHLAQALTQAQTALELAQSLNLYLPQTEAWLNRAVKEGKAEQIAGRYSVISATPQQLSLLN